MTKVFLLVLVVALASCTNKSQYDPARYYNTEKQQWILSRIVAHVFTAPPYVSMKDRLKAEHANFYLEQAIRFDLLKLYVMPDSTHLFLVKRPTSGTTRRTVGGSFKIKGKELVEFKEIFVTQSLPDAELQERSEFLFDQLVKGELDQYLKMKSYVQWPNEQSYYDTLLFEWKLRPEFEVDSVGNQ